MTREEATIQALMGHIGALEDTIKRQSETIKALDQEPILDKIRAEIKQEYKVECENHYGQGLRRAIEIIDKYRAESEE